MKDNGFTGVLLLATPGRSLMFDLKVFFAVLGAMLFLVGGHSWGRVLDTTTQHSYQHFRIPRPDFTWQESRDSAIVLGGHLATITSQEEFDFVISLFSDTVQASWLGGTDEAQEGVWQWITGEPWSYTRWAPGEPNNNGDEDYVYMRKAGTLDNWNDHGTLLPDEHFLVEWGCCDLPADFDGDDTVDVSDLTAIISWMFGGGPAPNCLDDADVNGDCTTDISDLTYRVVWMFGGGSPPVCGCVN